MTRKQIQARCFQDGLSIGVKTLKEWSEALDIDYHNIWLSCKNGTRVRGPEKSVLKFMQVEPEDPEYKKTLGEVNEEARAEGKSYGKLQAEKYLQQHPIITKKTEEADMETITLKQFCGLMDPADKTALIIVEDVEGRPWLGTIPPDSPMLSGDLGNMHVCQFSLGSGDENALNVTVKNP